MTSVETQDVVDSSGYSVWLAITVISLIVGVVWSILSGRRRGRLTDGPLPLPNTFSHESKQAAAEMLALIRNKVALDSHMSPDALTLDDVNQCSEFLGLLYADLLSVQFGDGQLGDCERRLRQIWSTL